MEKVVIGFSKARSPLAIISKLIMLAEHAPFSHAYVKLHSDSLSRDLIYQATGSGIYFCGTVAFLSHSVPVEEFEFEIPKETKTVLLQWCIDTSGAPYGKLQLLGLGLVRLASLFCIKINNPFASKRQSYICTELAAVALKEIGLDIKQDDDLVGLNDLHKYVKDLTLSRAG